MKRGALLLLAAGLVLGSSLLSLAGVAWNRSGEPDSRLALTQRELPLAWNDFGPEDNSSLALRLDWQQENRRPGDWRGPDWLNRQALLALGFSDLPEDGLADYSRWPQASRNALVVLEFDGPAYRRELARAEAELRRLRDKGAEDEQIQLQEKSLERLRQQDSRLYAVDAGPDRQSLRQRYPDRSRYALVQARISASLTQQDNRWYVRGYVSELRLGDLHLPLALREALRAEQAKPQVRRAGYSATLAFGQRLEPWVQDLRLEPRHD